MSEPTPPARTAEIRFRVGLNESHLPVAIDWEATDSDVTGPQSTRSVMLSVWNDKEKRAMSIDLWTQDMLVDEMKLFVFQSLMTTADTFERATSERELADELRVFANRFAEKLGFVRADE